MTFNIPSEPLGDALGAYTAVTGIEVFSTNGMIAGRRSSAVKGVYSPVSALRALLAQSGLTTRYIDGDFFTLVPVVAPGADPVPLPRPGNPGQFGAYGAAVQQAVTRALCGNPGTSPISYRAVLRFWIGQDGTVEHPMLLMSTGDTNRDTVLLALLEGMDIGDTPPADLPQPAIIMIVPQSQGSTGGCSTDPPTGGTP